MAKLRFKFTSMNMLVIAVALVGIVIAIYAFQQDRKIKRAQFAGVSNIPSPSESFLPSLDLGNVGDDLRYTINRASVNITGDPLWLKKRFKASGMHGIDGATHLDHSLNNVVRITPPVPIEEEGQPLLIASGPNDNQNHETVAGTFLPATGRMMVGGRSIQYPYFTTPISWGFPGTPHTPSSSFGLPVTEDLEAFGPGQQRYGSSQTPSAGYLLNVDRPTVETSDIAKGTRIGQAHFPGLSV